MGHGCPRTSSQNGCQLDADRAVRDLMFDFALKHFTVDGNINGSGNADGIPDFDDDFSNNSLTASPNSSFSFPQPITISGGFLHFTGSNARIITRFSNRILEDDANFIPRLTDGAGSSTIMATFRADQVLPGQFYAVGVSNDTSTLTQSTAEAIISRSTDGSMALRVNDATGRTDAFTPINLTGVQRIILRLKVNDTNNTVMPSYSIDDGATFVNGPQFQFYSGPTPVFGTAQTAHIFVQAGVSL